MHEDHRERLRKRFLKEGLDGFEAHNVLELLLFFSIPRRDVNELAHTLIDRFGSVHGVFDASFEELCSVPGIGEYSATLLKLIPELSRVYSTEKNNPKMILGSEDAAGRFLVDIYRGITVETVYLILLGNKCDIIDCVRLYTGSVNSSAVTVRRIVELAFSRHASSVILAHNHPSGIAIPSGDDIETTIRVRDALSLVDIGFSAHMLIAGESYVNIGSQSSRL